MKRDLDNYVATDWKDRLAEYREEADYGSGTATSHSVPETRQVRLGGDGEVPGEDFHVFERTGSGSTWKLRLVTVFADGLVYAVEWFSLFEFVDRIRDGEVRAVPPEGATVRFRTVGQSRAAFSVDESGDEIPSDDFVADICDRIDRLNDRSDSSDRCIQAALQRARKPTAENRRVLEEAFEAVPILGDMDDKDYPIRALLAPSDTDEFDYGQAYIIDRYDDTA
ncbi:MAG: hypothetical protein ABEN55_09410 [Bradymonadaceae bacterium]